MNILSFKVDDDDDDDDDEEEQTIVRHKTRNTDGSNKDKIDSDLLIEPKSEYEDGNDEAVEDLTMADEELMEDLEQAGPSHGGEGSSQGRDIVHYIIPHASNGMMISIYFMLSFHLKKKKKSSGYAQWQVDRSQDEVYLSTGQESTGQHRDAQGEFH